MISRSLSNELATKVDQTVTVQGWVHARRDHGGLIFIDLRDHKGLVQLVANPDHPDVFAAVEAMRDEYVIEATGIVAARDESLRNPNLESGGIEIVIREVRILNRAETPPIQIGSEQNTNEETRLRYRYLDLRREKMQTMLRRRADYSSFIRKYMEREDFTEVATPILANSSPEGARDFLVPSRHHQGQYYALPQAPQQFKQLLMVGGVPRYYQIATCFRDEDPRADRLYGDFYQLDLEMSFVEDGEIVRSTMEPLVKQLVVDFAGKKLLGDDIPRLTYQEAMDRFGSDKPDLRFGMELVDLSQQLMGCEFGVFSGAIEAGGVVKAICAPGQFSRKQIDELTQLAKDHGAGGLPYMTMNDGVLSSSIAKFFTSDQLTSLADAMGIVDGQTILFGSDSAPKVNKVLGALRGHLGDHFDLKDPDVVALAWVIDFPFYEVDEKTGKLDFGHNPFSMPKGGLATLESTEAKETIVADQYDMVMNGYEICSGAVRNHNPDVMYRVFDVLGYDAGYVEEKFGAMLGAFKYGAPPHAGCAFGLDRIFMVLMNETNIREVVAFPKNGSGVDLIMSSPGGVDPQQLAELSIRPIPKV